MSETIDLTTRDGFRKAIDSVQEKIGIVPVLWLIGKIMDSTTASPSAEKQAEAAADIIRSGKESGVDKMTIVVDESVGVSFKAPVEGVDISASLGSKGKMTIDVTYK